MKKDIKDISGITLIALVVTIVVLLILAGISIGALVGEDGIIRNTNEAKEKMEIATEKEIVQRAYLAAFGENNFEKIGEEDIKNELDKEIIGKYEIKEDDGIVVTYKESNRSYIIYQDGYIEEVNIPKVEGNGENTWTRGNGKIDIKFLKETTYTEGNPNKPKIEPQKMIPVNWDGTSWVITDEENWKYSYGETDETKKWANVMLRDTLILEGMDNTKVKTATIEEMKGKKVVTEGSMLVWIPRYAYKITYYEETDIQRTGAPVGYSDSRGIVDREGKTPKEFNKPVTSISVGDYYRPHPAFENGSNTGYTQGEWSCKLTGIWVGKFETTKKVDGKITMRPNEKIYGYSSEDTKTVGLCYTEALNLEIGNSHMIKNSEWGAMAYLSQSKYGRNGAAIAKNTNINGDGKYLTGNMVNIEQSTTGNIYGIYDTVGGAYEYTACYVADNTNNYGNAFASTDVLNGKNNKTTSTKYATVYEKVDSNIYSQNYNANINKIFGDAIVETSIQGEGNTSWNLSNSNFIGLYTSSHQAPYMKRGGSQTSSGAGLLYFHFDQGHFTGVANNFRVCMCIE